MDNVPLADAMAGGPRTDLDDVSVAKPVPVTHGVYRVPEELPLLDYLESQVLLRDLVSVMDKFFDWPRGVDKFDAMQELLFNLHVRDDGESTYTTRGLSISQVRRMYCRYGEAVWRQNLQSTATVDELVDDRADAVPRRNAVVRHHGFGNSSHVCDLLWSVVCEA